MGILIFFFFHFFYMLFDQKFSSVLLVPIANGGEGHHTLIRKALQLIDYIGIVTAQPLKVCG